MAKLFGKDYTRQELLERVGDISQIAGVRKVTLADGKEKGVETYLFQTGSGFNFAVPASRGLDISWADWKGMPLAFLTPVGEVAPEFYDDQGLGWLRSFYAGLLTTCGLTQVGPPNVDQGESLGLHGRVSNIPAQNVAYDGEWQGNDYVMWVKGKVREAVVFGENLLMTRKISARLGEDKLIIEDRVENMGYKTTPHMILYHINGGFPAVDTDSTLISPTLSAEPRDEEAKKEAELYYKFGAPTPGFAERVYSHKMAAEPDGTVITALVNRNAGDGFGFYVKYNLKELPWFTEWKMNGAGTYVVGMEPGNCGVAGRAGERASGRLQFLEPGESRSYRVEIGVIASSEAISDLEQRIARMKQPVTV